MNGKTQIEPRPKLVKQGRKLTSDIVIEQLKATHSAKKKAELLLSNLEKLKAEVAAIETQYNILNAAYSKICDDAISKITAAKTALEKDIEDKLGDLEIFETGISNLEARFKLGLLSSETYLKENEATNENFTPAARPQLVTDKAADSIEFGLDRIGDGIISIGETIAKIFSAISKTAIRKP